LSDSLLWFEKDHPRKYPKRALAAVTTHDLPTVRGRFGLKANEQGTAEIRDRLRSMSGLTRDAPIDEVIRRAYGLLPEALSAVIAATLEDAMAMD
jgi:4-alpha-glucanotransferase